ncbi:hypothetical protein SKAU_G00390300 [Synaphobranchus kaupii]|uniref:Uncharacterized protein n=1 Tax=Synaphobranchus kaupii TaxID=118154 RepID=A0A9Q1EBD6_SYNKA|nr:hypothetical protein SKAU_G00390300 [Synaphobranchus kaupii]
MLLREKFQDAIFSEFSRLKQRTRRRRVSQQVTVKAEPMDVDPPQEPPPAPSHTLGFSTLPGSEKTDSRAGFPDTLGSPQRALFCEDISVKMASELLFKLSERVSKTNNHKEGSMLVTSSSYADERFGQTPSDSVSKACSSSGAMLRAIRWEICSSSFSPVTRTSCEGRQLLAAGAKSRDFRRAPKPIHPFERPH